MVAVTIAAQSAVPAGLEWLLPNIREDRTTLPVTIKTSDGGEWNGSVNFPNPV